MKWILIVLLGICLCCCKNENKNVKRIDLTNGGYALIPYLINQAGDTLLNGIGKYYSDKGELTDEIEFKNSKKKGWHNTYNSGRIYSRIFYLNGLAAGKGFFYNKSGRIGEESYYENGKIRITTFFDSSGKINLINFYDDTNTFYAVKYDNTGAKISEKGVIFAHNFEYNQKPDSIKAGTLFEMRIPVVLLPNHTTNIEVAKFNSKQEVYELIDSLPIENYFAIYRTFFNEFGQQRVGIAGELKTMDGKPVRKDTLYKKINVY